MHSFSLRKNTGSYAWRICDHFDATSLIILGSFLNPCNVSQSVLQEQKCPYISSLSFEFIWIANRMLLLFFLWSMFNKSLLSQLHSPVLQIRFELPDLWPLSQVCAAKTHFNAACVLIESRMPPIISNYCRFGRLYQLPSASTYKHCHLVAMTTIAGHCKRKREGIWGIFFIIWYVCVPDKLSGSAD